MPAQQKTRPGILGGLLNALGRSWRLRTRKMVRRVWQPWWRVARVGPSPPPTGARFVSSGPFSAQQRWQEAEAIMAKQRASSILVHSNPKLALVIGDAPSSRPPPISAVLPRCIPGTAFVQYAVHTGAPRACPLNLDQHPHLSAAAASPGGRCLASSRVTRRARGGGGGGGPELAAAASSEERAPPARQATKRRCCTASSRKPQWVANVRRTGTRLFHGCFSSNSGCASASTRGWPFA